MSTFLWALIVIGVVLRLMDLTTLDFVTDEAQFAMGSRAHPTTGITLFGLSQLWFGPSIVAVRAVSVVFGIATLGLLYIFGKREWSAAIGLYIAAIAAVVPSHIFYSRTGYLDVLQLFGWLLTIVLFQAARQRQSTMIITALFLASLAACQVKVQGLLVPGFLLLGRMIETRKRCFSDTLCWALFLSIFVSTVHMVTSPEIAAILGHTGQHLGFIDVANRVVLIGQQWYQYALVFVVLAVLSLSKFRALPWAMYTIIITALSLGIFLSAQRFYLTYLVVFAVPLGLLVATWKPRWQVGSLSLLTLCTIVQFWPTPLPPFTHFSDYAAPRYWQDNASAVNTAIGSAPAVTVLGNVGHHIRWYVEVPVLVGKKMEPRDYTDTLLVASWYDGEMPPGYTTVYDDEVMAVMKKSL